MAALAVGGGLAGLAGMGEAMGSAGRLRQGLSPGYGFTGFLISWLAGGRAMGILVMAFLFAVITSAGDTLQITQGLPYSVVNILLAMILFIVLSRRQGGRTMSAPLAIGVLAGAVLSGTSLLYATLGETIGERAGIVNLGLEGVLLIGASVGFAVAAASGSAGSGLLAAAAAGGLTNLLFGWLVVTRRANQLASGLAMMFFGFGRERPGGRALRGCGHHRPAQVASGLAGRAALGARHHPVQLRPADLAGRARGRAGLVGCCSAPAGGSECARRAKAPWRPSPPGAGPGSCRYQALAAGGVLGGLAGAHLSLSLTLAWAEYMTAGRGFIAIALVIFSKWNPLRAVAGALLFGGAEALELQLQAQGSAISPFILEMSPYLLTLLVLLAWGGARRLAAPAGLGRTFYGSD